MGIILLGRESNVKHEHEWEADSRWKHLMILIEFAIHSVQQYGKNKGKCVSGEKKDKRLEDFMRVLNMIQ